jgi:ATP-dependent Lhr-like helicase
MATPWIFKPRAAPNNALTDLQLPVLPALKATIVSVASPDIDVAGMDAFHACTRSWFAAALETPTRIQREAWPVLAEGKSALLLAPTGSGKTLAAFLAAIDRLMFAEIDSSTPLSSTERGGGRGESLPIDAPLAGRPSHQPSPPRRGRRKKMKAPPRGVRVLYISPLKALAVDVDRNLRAPLVGIQAVAEREGVPFTLPRVAVRSGDTSAADRREIVRHPPDILITTPESLYLLLTSQAREILADVETVIVDEIHAVAATKRGAHLFLTLERLEALDRKREAGRRRIQRIGLSATQRPLEEIARLLAGADADVKAEPTPRARPV